MAERVLIKKYPKPIIKPLLGVHIMLPTFYLDTKCGETAPGKLWGPRLDNLSMSSPDLNSDSKSIGLLPQFLIHMPTMPQADHHWPHGSPSASPKIPPRSQQASLSYVLAPSSYHEPVMHLSCQHHMLCASGGSQTTNITAHNPISTCSLTGLSNCKSSGQPEVLYIFKTLLHMACWLNNKSNDPTDIAEPEDSGATELKGKKSGSSASTPPFSSSSGDGSDPANFQPSPPQQTPTPSSVAKQSIPEIYPQVLALAIAQHLSFLVFTKLSSFTILQYLPLLTCGQPYLSAFLLKDETTDSDVITDINLVYLVGIFAQIMSVFSANTGLGEEKEEELLKAGEHPSLAEVSLEEIQLVTPPKTPPPFPPPNYAKDEVSKILCSSPIYITIPSQLSKSRTSLPSPALQDDQYIHTFMSEIVALNVFNEPNKLADFAAAVSSSEISEDVLKSLTAEGHLCKAVLVLKKELINTQLQGIKKELGMESDGKDRARGKHDSQLSSGLPRSLGVSILRRTILFRDQGQKLKE
ncbi:hypothetical protein V8E55_004605 [Tylopilus felleus]